MASTAARSISDEPPRAASETARPGRRTRWLLHAAGWTCIVLGLAGLVLPVLQGILFLLAGLVILSRVSPRARRLLERIRSRFPGAATKLDMAEKKAAAMMRRFRANGRNGA